MAPAEDLIARLEEGRQKPGGRGGGSIETAASASLPSSIQSPSTAPPLPPASLLPWKRHVPLAAPRAGDGRKTKRMWRRCTWVSRSPSSYLIIVRRQSTQLAFYFNTWKGGLLIN